MNDEQERAVTAMQIAFTVAFVVGALVDTYVDEDVRFMIGLAIVTLGLWGVFLWLVGQAIDDAMRDRKRGR